MKKQLNLIIYLTFAMFAFNAQANLISNPGFEAGLTDWTNSGASIRTEDPETHDGSTNYIFGEAIASFTISQDIDLLSLGFSESVIDTGIQNIVFGGWQSGWSNNDEGQISIRLFDVDMLEIGATSLSAFTSDHFWVEQSGTADLLIGTRFIQYEFTGTRIGAFTNNEPSQPNINNDAYLDSAYLNVDFAPVPVPAAVWLFGSGLIGLIGLARRKAQA